MRGTWMLVLAGVLAIGLLAGCNDDTTEVIHPEKANVTGFVLAGGGPKAYDPSNGVMAYVSVSEAPVTPAVYLNGVALALEPEYSMYANGFGFVGAAEMADDGNATVAVDMGSQRAAALVPVPGFAAWISPVDGEVTVEEGSDATMTWEAADRAEGYWLTFSFEVDYVDTAGVSRYWENDFSAFVEGTSYTLTTAQFLPPTGTIDSIDYFWGDGDLFPFTGPLMPGSTLNVMGDASGAVIGLSEPMDMDFRLGTLPVKAEERERDDQEMIRRLLLTR